MNETGSTKNYVVQNEFDLEAIWKTIVKKKKFITILTTVVTFLGVVNAFMKTPLYEVKAVLEIGSYYNTNNINILLESPFNVVKRLELNYLNVGDTKAKASLEQASISKGSTNLVEIIVLSVSNEEGLKKLELIMNEVKDRHQILSNSYISSIHRKIENLEQQKNELLEEKQKLTKFIEEKIQNTDKIIKDNSAVAAIYTIELNNKTSQLTDLNNKIHLINTSISDLITSIAPNNLKQTALLGNIAVHDYPVKPNKKLIIALAFGSGLILSLFFAFLMELLKKQKNK